MDGIFQPLHILVIGAGGVVLVIWVLVSLMRKRGRVGNRLSSLEAENQRLREEIDRLKSGKG